MTDKQIKISETKRYCEGIDCLWCDEKEPCIYKIANELEQQLKRKEQECERLSKGYAELTDIVEPYMGDFTGYNEELGGFDIVLCVKEILDQLKKENEELKKELELNTANAVVIDMAKRLHKYKQALTDTKENIEKIKDCTTTEMVEISTRKDYDGFLALKGISVKTTKILQKISEVLDD